MISPTSSLRAPRAFRTSVVRRIPLGIVLSAVILVVGVFGLPQLKPVTVPRATFGTLVLAIIVLALVLLWAWLAWWTALRVVVTDEVVEVRRPFMVVHSWRRAETGFSSSVVRQRVNGVRSGTARSLIAHTRAGHTTVGLPTMPARAFSELLALLQAPAATGGDDLEALRAVPLPFSIEPDRRPVSRRAAGFAIVAGLLVAASAVSLGAAASDAADGELWTALGGVLAIVGVLLGVVAVAGAASLRRIPRRIDLSRGQISVDGQAHRLDALQRVWVSPPTYDASRRLRIERPGERPLRWEMGAGALAPKVVADWPAFVLALRAAAQDHPGLVSFDLE